MCATDAAVASVARVTSKRELRKRPMLKKFLKKKFEKKIDLKRDPEQHSIDVEGSAVKNK